MDLKPGRTAKRTLHLWSALSRELSEKDFTIICL